MSTDQETALSTWRNSDVDWDSWPADVYVSENYSQVHTSDDAVIQHHSAFYRTLTPASVADSLELGAGPNLYPLMLAAGVSRRIHAVERSAANLAYLERQLMHGAEPGWVTFYRRCQELNPDLPVDIGAALAAVELEPGDARHLPVAAYDLGSMHFVAESISEDRSEVAEFCGGFSRSVRPGGSIVAAFMENMARYAFADGSQWPGCPVGLADVEEFFAPYTDDLVLERIDADPGLPDTYGGYTGMIMLTARRAG